MLLVLLLCRMMARGHHPPYPAPANFANRAYSAALVAVLRAGCPGQSICLCFGLCSLCRPVPNSYPHHHFSNKTQSISYHCLLITDCCTYLLDLLESWPGIFFVDFFFVRPQLLYHNLSDHVFWAENLSSTRVRARWVDVVVEVCAESD